MIDMTVRFNKAIAADALAKPNGRPTLAHMHINPHSSRPRLHVDLKALKANYNALQALAPGAAIAASVKANAYGLGAVRCARALNEAGCTIFFVAHAFEGRDLRNKLGPEPDIYVLSGPLPADYTICVHFNLRPVINSLEQAQAWVRISAGLRNQPSCALHFDTGINRLGIPMSQAPSFASGTDLFKKLNVNLIMSHLACAGIQDHLQNPAQLKRFTAIADCYPGIAKSFVNTAGIYLGADYHFDIARPGIGLYGGIATDNPKNEVSGPVAEYTIPILQIKQAAKGDTLGYDARYRMPKDGTIAIIGMGYADGLPVSLSGSDTQPGAALRYNGAAVPILGRVSMDYTIIDITDHVQNAQIGDPVMFLGPDLEVQAKHAGLINYELLTHIGNRCKHSYSARK